MHFFLLGATATQWARTSSFTRFLNHTQRRSTVGRTPLDEWSAPTKRPLPGNTKHSQQTDILSTGGNRTRNLSRRAATDLQPRPRCHWDQHRLVYNKFDIWGGNRRNAGVGGLVVLETKRRCDSANAQWVEKEYWSEIRSNYWKNFRNKSVRGIYKESAVSR